MQYFQTDDWRQRSSVELIKATRRYSVDNCSVDRSGGLDPLETKFLDSVRPNLPWAEYLQNSLYPLAWAIEPDEIAFVAHILQAQEGFSWSWQARYRQIRSQCGPVHPT